MAKREKKTIISGVSREAMEDAFRAYADADAKQRSLTAEMDGKLVEIREDYADRLAELDAEKKAAFEKIQEIGRASCRERVCQYV